MGRGGGGEEEVLKEEGKMGIVNRAQQMKWG